MMGASFKTGLVSVSFRALSPAQIIDLVQRSGLESIEWGGDIHVPAGNTELALQIGEETRKAGLQVACYGSYYHLTDAEEGRAQKVLSTAHALGAPLLRVWAGNCGSAEASPAFREEIARNLKQLCEESHKKNIQVVLEHHGGTLTDTAQSSLDLLRRVDHPAAATLWQPPVSLPEAECVSQIRMLAPYIRNIHVFSWEGTQRLPLSQKEHAWHMYLEEIKKLPGEHSMMLEFVRGDESEQLIEDAACLKRWLWEI